MSEPAKKLFPDLSVETNDKDIKSKIHGTHTDELIVALCGPIGSKLHQTARILSKLLSDGYAYECVEIRLSNLIRKHRFDDEETVPITSSKFEELEKLINDGNRLREEYGSSILAELAINEITVNREKKKDGNAEYKSQRVCYIIDSIKNKEELDLLRLVYSDIFYCIGVFSSLSNRVSYLQTKELELAEVYQLIDRDSGEEMQFGQKVTDTFVESDYFLRYDTALDTLIEDKLKRFLHLVFSSSVLTPTSHETAMYLAFAAAGNSACLSRQVGAAITNQFGEVISVGWNDVPKAGGSVYKYEEINPKNDHRCFNIDDGICHNDREKSKIAQTTVDSLINEGLLKINERDKAIETLQNSRIKELIEFSRAVHAEMLAIILAGQKNGGSTLNGRLYCTTYPCHNCARHIIAAGISEVYFIEPYRKSLATKLHSDSITEDESKENLVRIMMYDGTAPRRYLDFFKMESGTRKHKGTKIFKNLKDISPKKTLSLEAIPVLESMITKGLTEKQILHG